MSALKVYSVDSFPADLPPEDPGDPRGACQRRCYVATTSRKKAAALIGCSLHYFTGYGSDTANDWTTALVMAEPETVFVMCEDGSRSAQDCYWIRAKLAHEGGSLLRCYGDVIPPARDQHELLDIYRTNKGYTAFGPRRPVYGTAGRCRCGERFKANVAPSKGGKADVRRQHHDHVFAIAAERAATS